MWRTHLIASGRNAAAFWIRRLSISAFIGCITVFAGCGRPPSTDFPNRLVGADGQEITLDDITAITDDPDLSTDEKRQALRDLGIEDEQLIDVFLTL